MHDQKAVDGGSGTGHSLFAEALLDAIRDRQADKDGDGYIKTTDLFSHVQDYVSSGADRLYGLRQTPDYGQLPGDGSGDLVLSLKEGAFSRMTAQAYWAMLTLDADRLEELVAQLVKVREDSPEVLYFQYRLRVMRNDLAGALRAVTDLLRAEYREGIIPLSKGGLEAIRVQLGYWQDVLVLPAGRPPLEVKWLTESSKWGEFAEAPIAPFSGGSAYQLEEGAIAQVEVHNVGAVPAYLYFIDVEPTGLFTPGPLLRDEYMFEGLAPGAVGRGPRLKVYGLPGCGTETRVYYSTRRIPEMLSPKRIDSRALQKDLDPEDVKELQMMPIWHQIPMGPTHSHVGVQELVATFGMSSWWF